MHPDDLPQTWSAETSLHSNVTVSLGTVARRLAGAPSVMTDFHKVLSNRPSCMPATSTVSKKARWIHDVRLLGSMMNTHRSSTLLCVC